MKIRPLTECDLGAAQRLRAQAGWNQTEDDWRRLLAGNPAGCWAAERDGQVVGTTVATTYGQRIAWIGMVLVDADRRRQGIGGALLAHAVAALEQLGIQTIALDSTPEGQPLYARLGFVDRYELARWRGPAPEGLSPDGLLRDGVAIRPMVPADLAAVVAYDAPKFGTERPHILASLLAGNPRSGFLASRNGQVVGYALGRPGAFARHLGPLAADAPDIAERLALAVLSAPVDSCVGAVATHAGSAAVAAEPEPVAAPLELVMDVVMPNLHAVHLAGALGLAPVRRFIRMTRGAQPPAIDTACLYTSAGPELG